MEYLLAPFAVALFSLVAFLSVRLAWSSLRPGTTPVRILRTLLGLLINLCSHVTLKTHLSVFVFSLSFYRFAWHFGLLILM
jgi:hypothetical protein